MTPKIFSAHLREMTERCDPAYFLPEYQEYEKRLKDCGLPLFRLSRWIESIDSGIGIYDLSDKAGWRYLNVNNIVSGGIDAEKCGYVSTPPNTNEVNVINCGDIVTGRVGTIGVFVKYADETPAYISDNVFRIRLKDCDSDYILAVLNSTIVQNQIERTAKGSLQRVVNKQTIRNLKIPLPPPEVQREIVAELDAAYAAKRKADEKAAQLLASIDDMVLKELGIAKLPKPDTSLFSRIFTVPARKVANMTLAPDHYFDAIDFSKAKYPCERFVERIEIDPSFGLEQITKLVPMESVSAEWCVIESIEDISPDATQGYSTFRGGDVIWARITPCMENGKSAVVEAEPSECFCGSTEFLVFRPKDDKVNPYYLQSLLHLKRFREVAAHNFTGTSGHQRVTAVFFKTISIPIPPRSVQDRIASMASSIRTDARKLKADATAALDAAKRAIEAKLVKV